MSDSDGIHLDVVLRHANPAPRRPGDAITVFITVAGIRDALTFAVSGHGGIVYVTIAIRSGQVLHVTPNPDAVEHGLLDEYVQIALTQYRARLQLDTPEDWLRWVNQPPTPYREQLAALVTPRAETQEVACAQCRYVSRWHTEYLCGYHGTESQCRPAGTCPHFEVKLN